MGNADSTLTNPLFRKGMAAAAAAAAAAATTANTAAPMPLLRQEASQHGVQAEATKLIIKNTIDDGEQILRDIKGVPHLKISARTEGSDRVICALDGTELWKIIKRPEGIFELIFTSGEQPTVIHISGTTQNPKLYIYTPPSHPQGPKYLRSKGKILKREFLILQQDPVMQNRAWVKVAAANPIAGAEEHTLSVAAGIDVAMMAGICIAISELECVLSPNLSGLKFNPPVTVFPSKPISEKKTILTPLVMNGVVAVTDCDMNTMVFRDAHEEGKGLFLNTHGDIVFNFELRGKLLCIPLRTGSDHQDLLVFSKTKVCRGVNDILVSRVRTLAEMDRKEVRKANSILMIRTDCGACDPVIYKCSGRPSKRFSGQLMGKMVTVSKSPEQFSEILQNCVTRADPMNHFNVKHMGLSGVFVPGVDLCLASALTLATLMFYPKLVQPGKDVPDEVREQQIDCSAALNLDPIE